MYLYQCTLNMPWTHRKTNEEVLEKNGETERNTTNRLRKKNCSLRAFIKAKTKYKD